MTQFMGQTAVSSCFGVEIVENDDPVAAVKDGAGGEDIWFFGEEVGGADALVFQGTKRESGDGEVLGEGVRVESVKWAETQFAPYFAC